MFMKVCLVTCAELIGGVRAKLILNPLVCTACPYITCMRVCLEYRHMQALTHTYEYTHAHMQTQTTRTACSSALLLLPFVHRDEYIKLMSLINHFYARGKSRSFLVLAETCKTYTDTRADISVDVL